MSIDLRSYVYIDALQPQHAAFTATVAKGFLPEVGQTSLFIEIAPGIAINRLTDIAVKETAVTPGMQIVERVYGMLEIHHHEQAEVQRAGEAILKDIGAKATDRLKPRVVSSTIIRNVDDRQAQLINRTRHGHLLLGGDSLYVLEVHPAANAPLAANEAEKAANIKILEVRSFGSFGRVLIAGSDKDLDVAVPAAEAAILALEGRPNDG
jgi:hypothetical protein